MANYNEGRDFEVVIMTYDLEKDNNRDTNKSEVKIKDAKRKDNIDIQINQRSFDLPAATMNEQKLMQLTTYENAQKVLKRYEKRKTPAAEAVRMEKQAFKTDRGN